MEYVVRFIAGGIVVLAVASLADVLRPKSFAGLFGAAPSVALATLTHIREHAVEVELLLVAGPPRTVASACPQIAKTGAWSSLASYRPVSR
jgi:hypothetical protein